jgi:hypothetical protein
VTPARLAVAAGIGSTESMLPKPTNESQTLVPYDDSAQQVLVRAFELAIAERAEMVDITHITTALESALPESST